MEEESEFTEIEVPKGLVEAVKQLIRERPELGYNDEEEFVIEAITHFLDRL